MLGTLENLDPTHSLQCSLMLILSLEPSSVLLNTGNAKLMLLTFYLFLTL